MGRLAYGIPSRHVKASKGADSNIMKFYTTENASNYGQRWSKFEPQQGRHTGTGYLSNFRPGVYYSAKIDELDNPRMGHMLRDNYQSVTKQSFLPYQGPSGAEPLPNSVAQVGSGFIRQQPLTIPTSAEIGGVCIDTRIASAPADVMPRGKPHLHHINAKDPVELENGGYGPKYMSTETSERFQGFQPDRADVSRKSVGYKQGSGFTHAHNEEPVTYHPDYAYSGEVPAWYTNRPTGLSIMKTNFRPSEQPKGDEPLPRLVDRAARDTGFTSGTKARPVFVNRVLQDRADRDIGFMSGESARNVFMNRVMEAAYDKASDMPEARVNRIKKGDPAEYLNTTNPNNYSSITTSTYRGQQRPGFSESDRLGRTAVGSKELTGFCENNDRFVQTADNPARFVTHYMTKFQDRTPLGLDREGHTWGGVQPQKLDGYTKSTRVHDFAKEVDSTATLRRLDPYVGRSVQARDPFFDDHTYDSKLHSTPLAAY